MFPRMQNRVHSEQVMDKIHHVSLAGGESYNMNPYDHVVIVTQTGSGAVQVNLPDVAESAGMMYLVYAAALNVGAIVVRAKADATYTVTDVSVVSGNTNIEVDVGATTGAELSAADEYVLLVSTGISWHILASRAIAQASIPQG